MSATCFLVCIAAVVSSKFTEAEVVAENNKIRQHMETCQHDEFTHKREECNRNYSFLFTRSDSGCNILQIYVDCISMALKSTECTSNPFFMGAESNIVQKKMRDRGVDCNLRSDILKIEGPKNYACLRVRAVKLFFSCGSAYHFRTKAQSPNNDTLCRLLRAYRECGEEALKKTNCSDDDTLKTHLNYFLDASLNRHVASCANVTSLRYQPALSKVLIMRQVKECLMEDALRRYFTCGSNFLWKMVIWKRHFAKHKDDYGLNGSTTQVPQISPRAASNRRNQNDEVCTVVKEFQECTTEITSHNECQNLRGLSKKMITMQAMLIGEQIKRNCKFTAKTKDIVYPAASKQSLPPPGCSYRRLVKLFSYCTVNFFSSFEMAKDAMQECMFLGRHSSCVAEARKATRCNMEVKELGDFAYLTNVVQDKYASRCKGQETSKLDEKKAMAGVPSLCRKKTLLQHYFKLSLEFQGKLLDKADECLALNSFSNGFMEARAETECTYTDSTFISLMQMQTELMTDSVRSRCSQKLIDLNVLLKCSQAEALKKMLLCGLSYNKLLEDLKKQGEFYVTATTCGYLAEFQHCMIEVERSTGCTKSELHLHTSTVLNFWTWNVAPLCESAASLLLNDVDPKCDFPKSIHKALMCGREFQEYAEQATWEIMTFSQSCSSLETFDKCLQRALEVRQCRHSLGAKTQVSLIKSMLLSEYKISCRKMYQSAPGPPGKRSDEYPLSDYNYYFGDEIVRTNVTDKHIEGVAEDDARRRGIAPAKRARSHLMDKLARPLREKIKRLGFKNVMNIAKKTLIGLTEVLTSTPVQSNSSNSSNEITSTPSSVIVVPVVENDNSLCDMTAYEKESQRCNRYISEQAKSYRKNLKYVPSANSKGLTESVCKMAEHYRACLSDVAERHRCLLMLARTPRKVEKSLAKVGLAFCSSTVTDSGSSLRRGTSGLTLVLIVGICWKLKALN